MYTYITKEQGYALRLLLGLTDLDKGEILSIGRLAAYLEIPYEFAAGIIHKLRKENLVTTFQGRNGGVKLAVPPETISVFDALQAVGFHRKMKKCSKIDTSCPWESETCTINSFFVDIESTVIGIMCEETIASLYEKSVKPLLFEGKEALQA